MFILLTVEQAKFSHLTISHIGPGPIQAQGQYQSSCPVDTNHTDTVHMDFLWAAQHTAYLHQTYATKSPKGEGVTGYANGWCINSY